MDTIMGILGIWGIAELWQYKIFLSPAFFIIFAIIRNIALGDHKKAIDESNKKIKKCLEQVKLFNSNLEYRDRNKMIEKYYMTNEERVGYKNLAQDQENLVKNILFIKDGMDKALAAYPQFYEFTKGTVEIPRALEKIKPTMESFAISQANLNRGYEGEKLFEKKILENLKEGDKVVFSYNSPQNPFTGENSAEIDAIIISKGGLFICEIKNYNDKTTFLIDENGNSETATYIENEMYKKRDNGQPVLQAIRQRNILKEVLGWYKREGRIKKVPYISNYVVMVNENMDIISKYPMKVVYLSEFLNLYKNSENDLLSQEEVDRIYYELKNNQGRQKRFPVYLTYNYLKNLRKSLLELTDIAIIYSRAEERRYKEEKDLKSGTEKLIEIISLIYFILMLPLTYAACVLEGSFFTGYYSLPHGLIIIAINVASQVLLFSGILKFFTNPNRKKAGD